MSCVSRYFKISIFWLRNDPSTTSFWLLLDVDLSTSNLTLQIICTTGITGQDLHRNSAGEELAEGSSES